jgi:hypothetical protein
LEKASTTYIGDDLHSFCSPLTKRPQDSHRIVPASLVNIAHLPKLNKSSGFAHDWTACVALPIAGAARHRRGCDAMVGCGGPRRFEATTGRRWAAMAAQMKEAAN